MDILSILAKDHDKWVKAVENMGANKLISEDIVQDTYIRVTELRNPVRILYNASEVNYWYFYQMLRSTFINNLRVKRPILEEYTNEVWCRPIRDDNEELLEQEEAWERLYQKIIAMINQFGKYGSVLSQMYFKTDYSLRDLSDMSEISLTSIYNSIKKYRKELQEEFGEDWEDYLNKDFDKI